MSRVKSSFLNDGKKIKVIPMLIAETIGKQKLVILTLVLSFTLAAVLHHTQVATAAAA